MPSWRRPAPKAADLDNIDSLALSAPMLETAHRLLPAGTGSFCYRENDDRSFHAVESSARDLLVHYGKSPGTVQVHSDDYGFKWLVVRRAPTLHPSLVTDLRAASKLFADNKLGAQLLCAMTVFQQPDTTPVALIYLYKRGTIYPFAPQAGQTRNKRLELAIKDTLEGRVPVESDLARWFPIWNAPGLKQQRSV